LPQDHSADPDALAALEGLAQEGVSPEPGLGGLDVVGAFEEGPGDVRRRNEIPDIDGLGGLDPGLGQVLVGHDHELSLGVLVALDDLAPGDFDAVGAADAAILDRCQIGAVELAKTDLLRGFAGRVEADRDGDETEADVALPDRPGHTPSVPQQPWAIPNT